MATPAQKPGSGRAPSYPYVPEETWWNLRRLFQTKGAPKPSWDEEYLVNQGIRGNLSSARNVVRPFKRFGFFTEEGKALDPFWDWVDNAKYPEVCSHLLHELYPETVTHAFTGTDDEQRARLELWFQRNADVKPNVARQYAGFYMLLLDADPSKQDEAKNTRSRSPRPANESTAGTTRQKSRDRDAKARATSVNDRESSTSDTGRSDTEDAHEHFRTESSPATSGGFEPSLNINVQIHIPADATTDQIEQIFKCMAKHLYKRQGEASE